jgi:undecaprenyl-diphosphatase
MPPSVRTLPLRHAVILGLLHGPSELLPISSSAHTMLLPWLAGWPYEQLDPRLRKSFEVALHAGTAAALLLHPPSVEDAYDRGTHDSGTTATTSSPRTNCGFLLAALAPPALTGLLLGEQIEKRLGTPAKIACGLLLGSAAMGGAEIQKKWHAPRARGEHSDFESNTPPTKASATSPTASDGLALGVAQAMALFPGVSRNGATLAAARARGFSRQEADRLSWTVGLPVIAAATLLQGTRLIRQQARAGEPRATLLPLAVGAASAFLSTRASSKALDRHRRVQLLGACIAYRVALAAHVIRHMRDNT